MRRKGMGKGRYQGAAGRGGGIPREEIQYRVIKAI
jgi:hypothetical protein